MLNITLSPRYEHLRAFIASLPSAIVDSGETVHNGRNLIKTFTAPDGTRLNVKRYHRPSLINAIVYSTGIRQPKGRRAYDYPPLLLAKGIETPEAVAYIEERHGGLLGFSYFVSVQCTYPNRFYEIPDDPAELYIPLAEAFARFTARMHEARMLHRDYSPGNILWQRSDDGTFHFSIVDINRMFFGEVSLRRGCANFARLWGPKPFFEHIARVYAQERHFDTTECLNVIMAERRRFWTKYARHHKVSYKLDL